MPLNVSTPHTLRIGLLAPYRGTNLGDGAIHTALIDNLARRFESVEFVGINLDPIRTSNLHNIRCHPITGLPVTCYWLPSPAPASSPLKASSASDRSWSSALGMVKGAIHATPVVGFLARTLVQAVRSVTGWRHELRQLRSSFNLARQLDLLIVAGSGQIDEEWGGPWGHPYSLFRWAVLSRLAGTRMVVLSVGASRLPSLLGRLFVGTALACARYRSYRSADSKALVSGFRFTRHDPHVPDLAFSLPIEPYQHRHGSSRGRVVGVSPISYGHPEFSPTPQPEIYGAYIRQLAAFVNRLVGRGFEVLLFTSGGDEASMRDLRALLSGTGQAPGSIDHVRTVLPSDVRTLLTELAGVDYIVASRLHGVLLSHVLAKPVIAISFDPKVDAHMHDMGQSKYLAWIETVTATDLERLFNALEQESEQVRAAVAARRESFKRRLATQYDSVATLVGRRVHANRAGLLAPQECE